MAGERLPDFLIGGAPKCGTTSLHFVLDQHPEIALPRDEVHYFDADDPISHPDFFFVDGGRLLWHDPRPSNPRGLDWYAGHFAPLGEARLIGEDSTTYLQSEVAPHRIAALLPEARVVFMLRNPVDRTYSQYWHLVCSGRVACSFEAALSRYPALLLGSSYAGPLARYLEVLGPDRVLPLLFEDFVRDTQAAVDTVTDFLGASRMTVLPSASWHNRTRYPSNLRGQWALNQIGRRIVRQRYRNHMGEDGRNPRRIRKKLHYWWFRYANGLLLRRSRPPPMREETRAYLVQHLAERNRGLEAILGRELGSVWDGFEGAPSLPRQSSQAGSSL